MTYFLCVCINISKCRIYVLGLLLKSVQDNFAYEPGSLLLKKFIGYTVIKEWKPKQTYKNRNKKKIALFIVIAF